MGSVLVARERLASAKKLAVALREAKSPFRKGELAELFLGALVETVECLVECEAERQGVDSGQ